MAQLRRHVSAPDMLAGVSDFRLPIRAPVARLPAHRPRAPVAAEEPLQHAGRRGQHPERAAQLIDWLDQTVVGWNRQTTPFVWNGPRLRRLGGSGAAVRDGYSIAV